MIAASYFDESLQKKSYILAESQKGSAGGDALADHATGSSFAKRANSSDDDDDIEIIESLSCKRLKTRTFIYIEDDPVVTMAGATNVIAHSESIAPLVLPKGTGTGGTPQSSKPYDEGGNSLMENVNVGKSMLKEDEETVEMQKVVELQRLYFQKDGQEQVCCICGDVGSLLTCDGCPVGMHLDCIAQGQSKMHVGDCQSCPFCISKKALQAVLNAKRAAKLAQKQFVEAKKILAQLHDGMPQKHEGIERANVNKSRMQQIGNESANHNAQQHVGADVNSAEVISGQHGRPLAQPLPDASGICDGQTGKAFLPQNAVPKSESPKAEVDGERHDGDIEQTSRPMKPKKKMSSGRKAIPGLRRKALPWTPQEEEALKDGVMKYSHDGGRWGFQWQRILESGFGVFDSSRTGVDLKDKWRNMQRRASPT